MSAEEEELEEEENIEGITHNTRIACGGARTDPSVAHVRCSRLRARRRTPLTPLLRALTAGADWTVLPGLSVVYDALYTGDLTFAASQYDKLLANHT